MDWKFVIALVLAIPIIVFPAFLWYLDVCGAYAAIWRTLRDRAGAEAMAAALARQKGA